MNAGFIGLGNLGKAIAKRLVSCGRSLTVYNRTIEKVRGLAADIADSPADVVSTTDIVFLCLYDSNGVRNVFEQDKGLLGSDIHGKTIVDFSTNHYRDVESFYELCHKNGASYLEVPVFGSVVPALNGTLTLVAGGDRDAYERVVPMLNDLAETLFFLETPGHATKIKLVNNMVLAGIMASLAEGVAMGEDLGIDKPDVIDILSAGAGNSIILTAKKDKLLNNDFSSHFSNALLLKDLNCIEDLADSISTSSATASFAKEIYKNAVDSGMENDDFSAIYKLFKK